MSPAPADRRRYTLACLAGGLLALVGFIAMLHASPGGFFRRETFGNFFDSQADAWLHGRWNVPASDLFIEGFKIGDKTYTYFGAWPSILRLPVLAVSDRASGHLTGLSMTIAFAVALTGVGMLQWRLREMFRPGRPCGRGECALAAAVVFTAGCGSSLLFLASRAWVYHEAILWGAAWALVAYERIIAFSTRQTAGRLAAAATFGALAFLSRASVGLGPLIAIGLLLLGRLLRAAQSWAAARRVTNATSARAPRRGLLDRLDWLGGADDGPRWVVPLLLAVLVPAVVYGYVNWSRFGMPFSVPWTKQGLTLLDPRHRAVLDANGGTYFGLKFAPTTLLQYLRPDALALDHLFPWINFPHFTPPVIGAAKFDTLDHSTSVINSMPAFVLLGAFGVVAAVSPRFGRTPAAVWLRVPLLGALGGVGLTVAISYIANRYLGDFWPLLTLAALIGLQALLRRAEEPERRKAARTWIAAAAVLAVVGLWVNGGLALLYARLYAPQHDADRVALLQVQRNLEIGGPHSVGFSEALPRRPAAAGTSWIVGACRSMYWSDGQRWYAVQGRESGGWFRLSTPPPVGPEWKPLVTDGAPGAGTVVGIRRVGGADRRVDVGLGLLGADGSIAWPKFPGRAAFGPGALRVDVVMDHALAHVRVTVDGDDVVYARGGDTRVPAGPFTVGADVRRLPPSINLCRDLLPTSPTASASAAYAHRKQ